MKSRRSEIRFVGVSAISAKSALIGALTSLLLATGALADDWTNQPLATPALGGNAGPADAMALSQGSPGYYGPVSGVCFDPVTGHFSSPPCAPGQRGEYDSTANSVTVTSTIPTFALMPSSNVGIDVNGFYADPTSPSGISIFSGRVPLSDFATSSSLAALQAQVALLNPAAVAGALASFQSQIDGVNAAMAAQSQSLRREAVRSDQGIAMALASGGGVELQSDEHFAIAMNMGAFRGQNGGAISAAYRVADHVSFNASFVGSFDGGAVGGRAGIRFGW